MKPIMLDLRKLTDAKIKQALPNRGQCHYADPCIIGTLMTPKQRQRIDAETNGECSISSLVKKGRVSFPAGQLQLADNLQAAFDDPLRDLNLALAQMRDGLRDIYHDA